MAKQDDPAAFAELSDADQRTVIAWLRDTFEGAETPSSASSYDLKHQFQDAPGGFYTTNGAFKGALLAAGFARSSPPSDRNWHFRLTPRDRRPRPEDDTFVAWLFAQGERPDPIGDIARDALADPRFPTLADGPAAVEAYLARQGASEGAQRSLARAVAEWRARS
ncbi:hypothetical protein [Methylobacterium isbiliense]|uniref:YozE SAM-like domain-containing protein n=1 Tax=Methylobacterium isbiliense TaxID=315478 RepID=A0ABQ4SHW6_9HYPH|nr:hypothetical protein [Methylobacterium isbiliense]MDN3627894.1 hypothetical protein [Methylobacterium isbiliense]GJE02707.1 hypothetical protein GMJLKIPL_4656 [Methylobacterium isbiliense]